MTLTSRTSLIIATLIVFLVAGAFLWFHFQGENLDDAPVFEHANMLVRRADGQGFPFHLEVATTIEQERYGLMFRRSLPHDAGMLFVYEPDQKISMWMKNTYIPLDMLFIAHNGTIIKIITHTQPFDMTPLSSDEPVRGVIEINGGEADRDDIRIGDKIVIPKYFGGS